MLRGIELGGHLIPAFADELGKRAVAFAGKVLGIEVKRVQILLATQDPGRATAGDDIQGIGNIRALAGLGHHAVEGVFIAVTTHHQGKIFRQMGGHVVGDGCGRRGVRGHCR